MKIRNAFARAVIIYSAVLVLIIAVALSFLAAFLHFYETNLPEKCAAAYVSSLDSTTLASLFEEHLGNISPYENGELILERSPYKDQALSFAKLAKEYTSQRPVYRLISGDNDIGKIILRRAEKDAPFGITAWEIESTELYAESVPGGAERLEFSAVLPHGAELYINGTRVSGELCKSVDYSGAYVLSNYNGKCDLYTINGLCTAPFAEAVYDGARSTLTIKNLKSDWFSEKERVFTLSVPSGAKVFVGSTPVSSDMATKGEAPIVKSEFEKHLTSEILRSDTYLISGDPEKAQISVYLDGALLDGETMPGGVSYLYSKAGLYKVSAILPSGAELFINGIKAEASQGSAAYSSLSDISYLAADKGALSGILFEADELLCAPSVTAFMNGKELTPSAKSVNGRTLSFEFYGESTEPGDTVLSAAKDFANAYFHYVANGAIGIEENYSALIEKTKAQSPAFKQLKTSKGSFEFVNQATYRIDSLDMRDFVQMGENLVCCKADFSVHLRYYKNEKQYEGTISLVLLRDGENYLVCQMIIDSES